MGPKAQWCLAMAYALHDQNDSAKWQKMYDHVAALFSAKAIDLKFEELARRGYLEYGVTARTAWLTDKGREALQKSLKGLALTV